MITLPRMPRVVRAAHAFAARVVTDAANRTDGARRLERVACRKAHGAKTAPQRSSTLYRRGNARDGDG
ncbi:conserved hypothetical protein [Paraburkholderia sabiae]|nr:conserved hypothetical protein [Paraburkholderia sabiae]